MDTTQYLINRDAFEAIIVRVTAKELLLFSDFIFLLLLLLLRRSQFGRFLLIFSALVFISHGRKLPHSYNKLTQIMGD